MSASQPSYTNNDASDDRSMRTATNDDMSIILMTQIGNDQICEDKDENQSDSSSEDSSSSDDDGTDNAKGDNNQEDLKVNDKDDYEEEKKEMDQWKGEEQWRKSDLMNQTVFDGIIAKRDRQDSLSSGDAEIDYEQDRRAKLFNSAEVESYDQVGKKFNYTG